MNKETPSFDAYIEQGNMGRHETFAPRYGWLKKGYDAVIARSINFNRDFQKREPIDEYLITAKSIEILSRFADSLEGDSTAKATNIVQGTIKDCQGGYCCL